MPFLPSNSRYWLSLLLLPLVIFIAWLLLKPTPEIKSGNIYPSSLSMPVSVINKILPPALRLKSNETNQTTFITIDDRHPLYNISLVPSILGKQNTIEAEFSQLLVDRDINSIHIIITDELQNFKQAWLEGDSSQPLIYMSYSVQQNSNNLVVLLHLDALALQNQSWSNNTVARELEFIFIKSLLSLDKNISHKDLQGSAKNKFQILQAKNLINLFLVKNFDD